MNSIIIPVSVGEAIDKQTILEIKIDKIASGNEYVVKEYTLVSSQINELLTEDTIFHKKTLRLINEEIWNLQDDFRDTTDPEVRSILCETIIQLNDARFRVKKKLDDLLNSLLKEQKGYRKKKAFFLGHLGLGDQINCIPIVRYLATRYDCVNVVCKKSHLINLTLIYRDDPTISFYAVDSDKYISPNYGFPIDEFKNITEGFEVFLCGLHSHKNSSYEQGDWEKHFSDLPFCFYRDLEISPTIFFSYHHIASAKEGDEMYELLKGFKYAVLQSSTSDGPLIDPRAILRHLNIDLNQTLLIDINQNLYPPEHIWHPIAEIFVNKPLPFYKKILIDAQTLILSDSSLFCMAIGLPLKCGNFYYQSRNNHDYTYIHKFLTQLSDNVSYKFIKLN